MENSEHGGNAGVPSETPAGQRGEGLVKNSEQGGNELTRALNYKMNSEQLKIKSLFENLVDGKDYQIKPATKEEITFFIQRAIGYGVDAKVIQQLVDLYSVADSFYYEIVIEFHHCGDLVIFEWWNDKELWLGQRAFNTLRWANGKFCLGDASNVSFSSEYEFDTLIGLIEGCIKEIGDAKYFDNEDNLNFNSSAGLP